MKKCLDKRQQMSKSGAAASSLPKCKYFEQMTFPHDKTANRPTDSNIIPVSKETFWSDVCDPIAATASSVPTTLCPATAASCVVMAASTTASNLSKRKAKQY